MPQNEVAVSKFKLSDLACAALQQAAPPAPALVLKQGASIPGNVKGVVLPERPVIDKILAAWIFIVYHMSSSFDVVAKKFWGGSKETGNVVGEVQSAAWATAGLYPIDVGVNKYQTRGAASSSECVCWDIGLIQKWGLEALFFATHGWISAERPTQSQVEYAKRLAERGLVFLTEAQAAGYGVSRDRDGLVDAASVLSRIVVDKKDLVVLQMVLLIGRNNSTGFLKKGGQHTLAWSLRELQKKQYAEDGGEYRHWEVAEVVEFVMEAITAKFRAESEPPIGNLSFGQFLNLPAMREYSKRAMFGSEKLPFSYMEYFYSLHKIGMPVDEVAEVANGIAIEQIATIQEQNSMAEAMVRQLKEKGELFLEDGVATITSKRPAVVNNTRVPRAILRQGDVNTLIVQNTRGNVAILNKVADVAGKVAHRLQQQEPDRWFYDPRFGGGAVLNGGHSFSRTAPTKFSLQELVAMVREIVTAK